MTAYWVDRATEYALRPLRRIDAQEAIEFDGKIIGHIWRNAGEEWVVQPAGVDWVKRFPDLAGDIDQRDAAVSYLVERYAKERE